MQDVTTTAGLEAGQLSSRGDIQSGWRPANLTVEVALLGLLCLLAFLGAAWVSDSVFERLPHTEDESAFLFQAQTVATGRLVADAPEEPAFFSIPFIIVRDGMWFGKYPPGFPAVLSLGVLVGHPWLVNALFAALCVVLVFLFARWLYGPLTALLAAALLTASPFFLLQAGSLLSHVVALFWTLLFLALYPLARSNRNVLIPIGAGAAIGMLFLTRPLTAVGIALPYTIWTLITIVRRQKIQRAFIVMTVAALPFVVAYLGYNEMTTGSPFRTAYELWWPFDRIGFGPDRGLDGHDLDDALRNTRANLDALAAYLFGWPGRMSLVPAITAVLVSAGILARRIWRRIPGQVSDQPSPETWDLILASVVVSLVAVHMLYWTPGQMYGPRYFFEAVGPLAILSARCFENLSAALSTATRRLAPGRVQPWRAGVTVTVALVVVLTVYAHVNRAPDMFATFRGWNGISAAGVELVESQQLENALVFVERPSWTAYAPFFTRNVPTLDSDVVYAGDRGPARNEILMQLYPGREYYLFGDGRLVRITP